MADGSEQAETVADVLGGSDRPLSEAEIVRKFVSEARAPETAEAILGSAGNAQFRWSGGWGGA